MIKFSPSEKNIVFYTKKKNKLRVINKIYLPSLDEDLTSQAADININIHKIIKCLVIIFLGQFLKNWRKMTKSRERHATSTECTTHGNEKFTR